MLLPIAIVHGEWYLLRGHLKELLVQAQLSFAERKQNAIRFGRSKKTTLEPNNSNSGTLPIAIAIAIANM